MKSQGKPSRQPPVEVVFEGTTTATLVAEAVLASIEACFASIRLLNSGFILTPSVKIVFVEDFGTTSPSFEVDPLKPTARLVWPKDLPLASFERSTDTIGFLTEASLPTMGASCVWHCGKELIERLAADEAVFEGGDDFDYREQLSSPVHPRFVSSR